MNNSNVPENLPCEDYNKFYYMRIPKKPFKSLWGVVIAVILLLILIPRIENNVKITTNLVKEGFDFSAEQIKKTPETFPALTSAGVIVGKFVYQGSKKATETAGENLASLAETFYYEGNKNVSKKETVQDLIDKCKEVENCVLNCN